MRSSLEAVVGNYSIYKSLKEKYQTSQKIPFRVSPEPLKLNDRQKHEIYTIGHDISDYFKLVDEMYQQDIGGIRAILNTGKPEIFISNDPSKYLFIRPDLIITPFGFSLCEIETSPFGLALAEMLNLAYRNEGFETLVPDGILSEEIRKGTPAEGRIIFTPKTSPFSGQLSFLADQVFSGEGRNWQAELAQEYVVKGERNHIYRGFYLYEYLSDPYVRTLIDSHFNDKDQQLIPSPTPYLEEKAILSFIYDKRFIEYIRKMLGDTVFRHLREIIPLTWIVGQEEFFSEGLPNNITASIELANLSRSKRTLVLKPSGFSDNGSWSRGVIFLHQQSRENALQILKSVQEDRSHLYVIQEFKKGTNIPMEYEGDDEKNLLPMIARVRLTPYFSVSSGQLIAIKATGCEDTDYIHGTSTSINTAVG